MDRPLRRAMLDLAAWPRLLNTHKGMGIPSYFASFLFFTDGVQDEVLTDLAKIADPKVGTLGRLRIVLG